LLQTRTDKGRLPVFGRAKMFFFEKRYRYGKIRWLISRILQDTINKKDVEDLIMKELGPIIGFKFAENIVKSMLKKDENKDRRVIEDWMKKLDD
jgi:hypothetical protein